MENLDYFKINAAMRSVYRFLEFKNINAPPFLIETERQILHRHFSELTTEEIIYTLINFQNYQKEQAMQTVLENKKMTGNVTKFFAELN